MYKTENVFFYWYLFLLTQTWEAVDKRDRGGGVEPEAPDVGGGA